MKRIFTVITVVVLVLFSVILAQGAEHKSFYVGTFKPGEPFLSKELREQVVTGMEKVPRGAKVKVFGYTDSSGSPQFNKRLARWRAKNVAEIIQNIDPQAEIVQIKGRPFSGKKEDVNYRMVKVFFKSDTSAKAVTEKKKDVGELDKGLQKEFGTIQRGLGNIENEVSLLNLKVEHINTKMRKQKNSIQDQQQSMEEGFSSLNNKIEKISSSIKNISVLVAVTLALVLFIVILMIIAVILWKKRREQSEGGDEKAHESKTIPSDSTSRQQQEARADEQGAESSPDREVWVEIDLREDEKALEHNRKKYSVRVRKIGTHWYSPFVTKTGRPVCREDFQDGIKRKHLRYGLRKGTFDDQIPDLVKKGDVKIED